MTEQDIQRKRIKQLEKEGYFVIKLIKTNKNGIPDIVALKKGSVPKFVEVKNPGKKPEPLQVQRLIDLYNLGFDVEIFDGTTEVVNQYYIEHHTSQEHIF